MHRYYNAKKEKLKRTFMAAIILYSLFMFLYWCIEDKPNPIKYNKGTEHAQTF